MDWKLQKLPYNEDFETVKVLKAVAKAHRALAELKGLAQSIPNQDILINTLTYQEALDSSEVESIVTTHDELYKSSVGIEKDISPASKEVHRYAEALRKGFEIVDEKEMLTVNHILQVQQILEQNEAGLRTAPGTKLVNDQTGDLVYEPPQHAQEIIELMSNLERFINDNEMSGLDPLIKMAIIHFQFESIHPFYDGNGRTGRIINILYLVLQGLLDIPILYLSRYVIRNKADYYRLLQKVRDENEWEEWLFFMLKAVEVISLETQKLIWQIKTEMQEMKNTLRSKYKFYSQDLLNHLFKYPYTKIDFVQNALGVSRPTASQYLNTMAEDEVLHCIQQGRNKYYVNLKLMNTLQRK